MLEMFTEIFKGKEWARYAAFRPIEKNRSLGRHDDVARIEIQMSESVWKAKSRKQRTRLFQVISNKRKFRVRQSCGRLLPLAGHQLAYALNPRVNFFDKSREPQVLAPGFEQFGLFSDGRDLQSGEISRRFEPGRKLRAMIEGSSGNVASKPAIPICMNSEQLGNIFGEEASDTTSDRQFMTVTPSRCLKPNCRIVCFQANQAACRRGIQLRKGSCQAEAQRIELLLGPL